MRASVAAAAAFVLVGVTSSEAAGQSVSDVFDRVHRSVVVIRTLERDIDEQRPVVVSSVGSGVLISSDGKVLTAAHLVGTAEEIRVEFPDGQKGRAQVLASEPDADVSLLQLMQVPSDAAVARLADSDRARIGDQVFVVGAPYGISHTLSVGHISARRKPGRVWDRFALAEFLQTDAAINRGNSGGPMFNMAGEVLGIVSHIVSTSGGFEGLGFVVAANTVKALLIERRSPWWGFNGELIDGDLLKVFNLPAAGLLIQRVVEDSPAAKLGLRGGFVEATIGERTLTVGGDLILRVQGVSCGEMHRVRDSLAEVKPGEKLTLTIMREGRVHELSMIVP